MPELPEVESFNRYLQQTSLNKEIKTVDIKSSELLKDIKPEYLKSNLEDNSFISTKRQGKYIFVLLNDNKWLVLHFGMTGSLKFFNFPQEKPPYDRIIFNFKDDGHLAFNDPRKFGKIYLALDIEDFIYKKRLGPDALSIDFKTFHELYSKRKGSSKSALMNQHVMSGIGNIYSDEILYQACIHPKTPFFTLTKSKINDVFNIMKDVLNMAIDRQINAQKLPESYIIPHRTKDGKCPGSNTKLKTIKISGRTSYYCPDCQKYSF